MAVRLAASLVLVSAALLLVRADPFITPNAGQVALGAWVDMSKPGGYDNPAAFNARTGMMASSFQLAQSIPLMPYNATSGAGGPANYSRIEDTGSSASIFLTVYPLQGLAAVQPSDWTALAQQILTWQSAPFHRQVMLRYAPEFQGQWMAYGMQPSTFVPHWRAMYTAIKAIAPDTAIIWSPNAASGYPYGITRNMINSTADFALLDTNHDGQLTRDDDAYSPYWPGATYVDWNGISAYWKGTVPPFITNDVTPNGFLASFMTGNVLPNVDASRPNFYTTYCAAMNKPCAISECGAAFHVNASIAGGGNGYGASQLAIAQTWYSSFLTNASWMSTFPMLRMVQLFEYVKAEDFDDLRDFRLSNNTEVRTAWMAAMQPLIAAGVYPQATARAIISLKPPQASTSTSIAPSAVQPTSKGGLLSAAAGPTAPLAGAGAVLIAFAGVLVGAAFVAR